MTNELFLKLGILTVALEPLLKIPVGFSNMALKVADPVPVEISPLAISTLPFPLYSFELARISVAGGKFFSFSSTVTPVESKKIQDLFFVP